MSEINDAAVEAAARVLCPRVFDPSYRPGPHFYDDARPVADRVAADREQERGRVRAALTAVLPHLTPAPSASVEEVDRLRASADEWWRLYDEQLAEVERLRAATVKPDREAVARALYDDDLAQGWVAEVWDDLPPETSEWYRSQADAVLALLPGRTEAEVRAEALREWISEWPTSQGDGTFLADVARDGLARADRLAAEGGAS